MADSWFFWILTCVISLYFVMLLLDFNKPSKKLMEQIDHQEGRRRDMTTRLAKLQEDIVKTKSSAEDYYKYSPSTNPRGPEGGQERVIRGGFFSETRPNMRTTHRSSAPETHTRENVGFRLALSSSE